MRTALTGSQATEPKATKDLLPHLQTLESHNVLPPNQKPNPNDDPSRPQKLDTTLLYIQIDETLFKDMNDEFTVKAAKTPEEVKTLLEVGFEFVCQKDDMLFFRKRK